MYQTIKVIGILLAFCASANGVVTINVNFHTLRDSGGAPITNDFTWFLVADTAEDGFSDPTVGDFLGGSVDDVIIDGLNLELADNGIVNDSVNGDDPSGDLTVGDPIRLVWFTSEVNSPTGTESFGTYRNPSGSVENYSDMTWNYQAAALTAWTLNALDIDAISEEEGGLSYGELSAIQSVIPEPSSALLAGLGCAVFFLRRRKTQTVT